MLLHILYVFIVGSIAGFINVNAGGGSFLTIPLLIFIGLPPGIANGTNRIGVFLMSITSIITFRQKGISYFRFSSFLAIPAIIGSYLGARVSLQLSPTLFKQILATLMIVMLLFILKKPKQTETEPKFNIWQNIVSFVGFFFIGIYGGFIQAGVGYFMIILLRGVHGLSLKQISTIRVTVVFFMMIIPIMLFASKGQINWSYGAAIALSTSFGGWLGTKWNVKYGDRGIKWILAFSLVILAVRLFIT
ncbi:MAG: hypothetical protein A2Y40_05945 [Candidatus Margulisbacteria bacterium GWF2_35_9]|nr:MAG: hypothetical protein A2Y40_05945 [Candidatus Margulisbacteria bacterium GWF2_35_9]